MAARESVGFIQNPDVRVIDASSAHRTHPEWVYGFPEMSDGQARKIAQARRVTNPGCYPTGAIALLRSEEHTSELQSLMRISYAVFCLKKKTHKTPHKEQ